jgi:hypothetical protein
MREESDSGDSHFRFLCLIAGWRQEEVIRFMEDGAISKFWAWVSGDVILFL